MTSFFSVLYLFYEVLTLFKKFQLKGRNEHFNKSLPFFPSLLVVLIIFRNFIFYGAIL